MPFEKYLGLILCLYFIFYYEFIFILFHKVSVLDGEGRGGEQGRKEGGREGPAPSVFLEDYYQTLKKRRDVHNKRGRFMSW